MWRSNAPKLFPIAFSQGASQFLMQSSFQGKKKNQTTKNVTEQTLVLKQG